jgi:hypothetical protein
MQWFATQQKLIPPLPIFRAKQDPQRSTQSGSRAGYGQGEPCPRQSDTHSDAHHQSHEAK